MHCFNELCYFTNFLLFKVIFMLFFLTNDKNILIKIINLEKLNLLIKFAIFKLNWIILSKFQDSRCMIDRYPTWKRPTWRRYDLMEKMYISLYFGCKRSGYRLYSGSACLRIFTSATYSIRNSLVLTSSIDIVWVTIQSVNCQVHSWSNKLIKPKNFFSRETINGNLVDCLY